MGDRQIRRRALRFQRGPAGQGGDQRRDEEPRTESHGARNLADREREGNRARFHYLHAPMSPLLVLIVAVLATTYAGPIVRFAAAPAVAIAFWRLALVLPVTGGLALWEWGDERGTARSPFFLMTLSGLLLAVH